MLKAWAIAALAVIGSIVGAGNAPAQEYFRGKTVTVVIGFSPGGGVDLPGRIFARHMAKHLEGSPTVIVRNMPGAGGAIALNYIFEKAEKDGLTVAYDSWLPIAQITETLGARFDYTKLTPVGAVRTAPFLSFANKASMPGGSSDAADIVKTKGLTYGGLQPAHVLDLHGRLSLDVLGVEYKYVRGYPSTPEVRTAIERAEVHITTHGLQGYRSSVEPNLVKTGVVVPLWYYPHRDASGRYQVHPKIPDMRPFPEVYERALGKAPSGIAWDAMQAVTTFYGTATNLLWGPPGMDQRAVAVMAKAFAAAVVDPEAIAEQEKAFGFAYEPVPMDAVAKMLASLGSMDPRLVAFFKDYMK